MVVPACDVGGRGSIPGRDMSVSGCLIRDGDYFGQKHVIHKSAAKLNRTQNF
jgi:hypothetical protein